MNTNDLLSIAESICPDRPAVIFDGQPLTFGSLSERTGKLAQSLRKKGVQKGDRVGILEVNCSAYVECYFAAAKIGAIFVPLNYRAKADELAYMIDYAQVKVLFYGKRYEEMVGSFRSECQTVKACIPLETAGGRMESYEDLFLHSSGEEIVPADDPEEVTILMYTAGTTGRPKAVPLRQEALVTYILENVEPASPEVNEKNLVVVPLYHVAGIQAMLAGIYGGRTLVLMRQFETGPWLEAVQKEQVSRVMLVPTMLKRILDFPDLHKYDLSSLKVVTYGAAPMPLEVIKKAIQMLPAVRFINAFGQTETASTITMLGPEDHIIEGSEQEKEKKLKRLASSIGKPLSDVEIRIVDEGGKTLPPYAVGEILAKGARVMKGYWKDEEKTAKVMDPDGWLHTGDKGWIDDEGYIYLAGRSDDMIIRGGENISPEEVEDVLYSHPQVEEAAVIGVPDPEWGQEPRAVVVLKPGKPVTAEELIEYCRTRLAGFKRPRSVVFVEALPRNSVGKVLKNKLREEYGQGLFNA